MCMEEVGESEEYTFGIIITSSVQCDQPMQVLLLRASGRVMKESSSSLAALLRCNNLYVTVFSELSWKNTFYTRVRDYLGKANDTRFKDGRLQCFIGSRIKSDLHRNTFFGRWRAGGGAPDDTRMAGCVTFKYVAIYNFSAVHLRDCDDILA